jgi:hypothetical protein
MIPPSGTFDYVVTGQNVMGRTPTHGQSSVGSLSRASATSCGMTALWGCRLSSASQKMVWLLNQRLVDLQVVIRQSAAVDSY